MLRIELYPWRNGKHTTTEEQFLVDFKGIAHEIEVAFAILSRMVWQLTSHEQGETANTEQSSEQLELIVL